MLSKFFIISVLIAVLNAETQDAGPICLDKYSLCGMWAGKGGCEEKKVWMMENCYGSCSLSCKKPVLLAGEPCLDLDDNCNKRYQRKECRDNYDYMKYMCPETCGICGLDSFGKPIRRL